jgi:hypothetical protein
MDHFAKHLQFTSLQFSALAAWHSGHRFRLQSRRSLVPIPPGSKVFRPFCIAVLLSKLNLSFEKNICYLNIY